MAKKIENNGFAQAGKFTVEYNFNIVSLSDKEFVEVYGDREIDDPSCVLADRYFVAVTNGYGQRWIRDIGFNCRGVAQKLFKAVVARLAHGGKLNRKYWADSFPVYGSRCYQEQGGEAELKAFEAEHR